MEISSSNLQCLTGVLMTQILVLGALVYGGMYLLERRPRSRLPIVRSGRPIFLRETVLKRETKIDLPVRHQVSEHEEEEADDLVSIEP